MENINTIYVACCVCERIFPVCISCSEKDSNEIGNSLLENDFICNDCIRDVADKVLETLNSKQETK